MKNKTQKVFLLILVALLIFPINFISAQTSEEITDLVMTINRMTNLSENQKEEIISKSLELIYENEASVSEVKTIIVDNSDYHIILSEFTVLVEKYAERYAAAGADTISSATEANNQSASTNYSGGKSGTDTVSGATQTANYSVSQNTASNADVVSGASQTSTTSTAVQNNTSAVSGTDVVSGASQTTSSGTANVVSGTNVNTAVDAVSGATQSGTNSAVYEEDGDDDDSDDQYYSSSAANSDDQDDHDIEHSSSSNDDHNSDDDDDHNSDDDHHESDDHDEGEDD